jgi:hypothetical protein
MGFRSHNTLPSNDKLGVIGRNQRAPQIDEGGETPVSAPPRLSINRTNFMSRYGSLFQQKKLALHVNYTHKQHIAFLPTMPIYKRNYLSHQ